MKDKITVFHGTNPKNVDEIKRKGLISKVSSATWYTVSTDFESALYHATSDDKSDFVYVIEFSVPIDNDKWDGYPYFWPAYVRNSNSKWFALKQPLSPDMIEKIHKIDYNKFAEQKNKGF